MELYKVTCKRLWELARISTVEDQQSKMDSSDIKIPTSSNVSQMVAVQGRAIVTDAPNYLLTTTQTSGCAGVAIRGQQVAILLHADSTTTENDIEAAVSKAREMDKGDLLVQYICHEDQKSHWKGLTQGIPGVRCIGCYRKGQRVIVCMDSGKSEIYMVPNFNSSPLYERLNEIKAWSILYNLLQFDKTPRKFGKVFLETIEDVTLAKEEAVNAFRGLKLELVTNDGFVDSKELESYIFKTTPDANLVKFLEAVTDRSTVILKPLLELCGEAAIAKGTLAEFYEESEEIQQAFQEYINISLLYAKEINDLQNLNNTNQITQHKASKGQTL